MDILKFFDNHFATKQKEAESTRRTVAKTSGVVVDARPKEQLKPAFDMDVYLERLEMVESSGGKNLKSRTSSASGAHQYTEDTWKDLTKRMGVNYTLEDRFNYEKSREVTKFATNRNIELLKTTLNREPTLTEVYMAHKLGRQGALKFFSAKPTDTIDKIVSSAALKANKAVFYNDKGKPKAASGVFEFFDTRFNPQ